MWGSLVLNYLGILDFASDSLFLDLLVSTLLGRRHIFSTNIEFVSICDNLDRVTKEYDIGTQTRDRGMNMEIVQDWYLNQGPRDEYGKIQKGWKNKKTIGRCKKDRKIR